MAGLRSFSYVGAPAIVTGAASGIGAALAAALVERGAHVVVADVDVVGAERVAAGVTGPGTARAANVDVTDPESVQAVVDDTVARQGRLALMFNNAGIALTGPVEKLGLEHWNRTIDVNLRGVVHGVAAAYPVMVGQRAGRIVNTASLAGLFPNGLNTPYTMSKHGIVGLSLALRTEAAHHGVGVTVLCPSTIETPLLDTPSVDASISTRRFVTTDMGIHPIPASDFARAVLDGVARNRAIVVAPRRARVAWLMSRASPVLAQAIGRKVVERVRTERAR